MEENSQKEEKISHIPLGHKMVSVSVPVAWLELRKRYGYSWRFVLEKGFQSAEVERKNGMLNLQLQEAELQYKNLEKEYKIRGIRLQKYITKYGVDEDILFKSE
jgi:predicted RNA-binding protein